MKKTFITLLTIISMTGAAIASNIGLQTRMVPSLKITETNRFCFGVGCLLDETNLTRNIKVTNTGSGQLTNLTHTLEEECPSISNITVAGDCIDGQTLNAGASCNYNVDATAIPSAPVLNPCDGRFIVTANTLSNNTVSDTSQLRYCQNVSNKAYTLDKITKKITIIVGSKTYQYANNNSTNRYFVDGAEVGLSAFETGASYTSSFMTITCDGLSGMIFSRNNI
jgi:hypothetical protein